MPTQRYLFANFTLDLSSGQLLSGATEVALRPKSFRVLTYLVQNPGRLIAKDELLQAVWGDTVVTDDTLTQCIVDIRRAIDDSDQQTIKTVPRRGYRLAVAVTSADGAPDEPGEVTAPANNSLKVAGLVTFLLLTGVALLGLYPTASDDGENASIAVMPFENATGSAANDYLAASLEDTTIDALSAIPTLTIFRSSSLVRSTEPSPSIDAFVTDFNIDYIVEGRITADQDGFLISTRLVRADNGRVLSNSTYQSAGSTLFEAQQQSAADIVRQFGGADLAPTRSTRAPADDVYRDYLQAKHLIDTTNPAYHNSIGRMLRQAIDKDPGYAPAWRELGRYYLRLLDQTTASNADIARIEQTLERALELDPNDAATVAYLGWHAADIEQDHERAAAFFTRALQLAPDDADVVRTATVFANHIRRFDQAIAIARAGSERNPLCMRCHYVLLQAYLASGRWAEAESLAIKFGQLFGGGEWSLGTARLMAGQPERAYAAFSESNDQSFRWMGQYASLLDMNDAARADQALQELLSDPNRNEWCVAFAYAYGGVNDEAFEALDRAIAQFQLVVDGEIIRSDVINIGAILNYPPLHRLRTDPRWDQLLLRLGLHDEQIGGIAFGN